MVEVIKMRTQIRKHESFSPAREFLPAILGKEFGEELEEKEITKLELFEKGLAKELKKEESIEQSVSKIIKMALVAEFGAALAASSGAKKMIETITCAIMSNAQLRKQVLFVIGHYTRT